MNPIKQFIGEEAGKEAAVTVTVTGSPATVQKAIKQLAKKAAAKRGLNLGKPSKPATEPGKTPKAPAEDVVESLITEAAQREVTAKFGPGTYFIGDTCYALNDEIYHGVWGDKHGFNDGVYDANGHKFAVAGTAYGDGEYKGSDGTRYAVDAGVIGITPKELWKPDEKELYLKGGRVVNVKDSLDFWAEDGRYNVKVDGKEFTINTDYDDEDDEEDDENEFEFEPEGEDEEKV